MQSTLTGFVRHFFNFDTWIFGSILNGVDDDFSTPFFVFTKYLRNAIK